MLLTEEEAKRKWCPSDVSERCVTTDCMAWRSPDNYRHDGERLTYISTASGLAEADKAGLKNVGYCGLAGKPE